MGVPTSEVGYTSATTGRGDHEVHKGHVVALGEKKENKEGRGFDGVIGIFDGHNPSGRTMALGLNQPLTEVSTRNISWG
jgi:hypothetical protein